MNKLLISFIFVILLTGSIVAGGIFYNRSDSRISIASNLKSNLASKEIYKIEVNASSIECNENECYAWVFQDGLINTEWRTARKYCSEYSKLDDKCYGSDTLNTEVLVEAMPSEQLKEESPVEKVAPLDCTIKCIAYLDYTKEQLVQMRDTFIKERIESYASTIKPVEKGKETIKIDEGGIVSE